MDIFKRRDLTIVKLSEEKCIVISCDSCGGIGTKPNDSLYVLPYYVGRFTARVALMEVISSGAEVVSLSNAVCCEMNDTGREIIRGVKDELSLAELPEIILTGSTEENFKTTMTAVGISAVGIVGNKKLRFDKCKTGDLVILLGLPKVGKEIILDNDTDLVQYADIKILLNDFEVREVVPVGSKGILFEAETLAELNFLTFVPLSDCAVDLKKSSGPATCAIAVVSDKFCIADNYNVIGKMN